MQYVSALALASLSGKAPSTSPFTKPRNPLSPSSMPLASPSMRHKSMQSSPHSTAATLMKWSRRASLKFQWEHPLLPPPLPRRRRRRKSPRRLRKRRSQRRKSLNLPPLLRRKTSESIFSDDTNIVNTSIKEAYPILYPNLNRNPFFPQRFTLYSFIPAQFLIFIPQTSLFLCLLGCECVFNSYFCNFNKILIFILVTEWR